MLEVNKFYNLDCMIGMSEFPDKYFDLAVVDPPYGLDKGSVQGAGKLKNRALNTGNVHDWDEAPSQTYFDELFRVSKNVIIWGGIIFISRLQDVYYAGIKCSRGKISRRSN